MNKYTGCNVVESVVSEPPRSRIKIRKGLRRGTVARLAVASAIICVLFFFAYVDLPVVIAAREAAARVFLYDVFGNTGFGGSPVITRIFGA